MSQAIPAPQRTHGGSHLHLTRKRRLLEIKSIESLLCAFTKQNQEVVANSSTQPTESTSCR